MVESKLELKLAIYSSELSDLASARHRGCNMSGYITNNKVFVV